MSRTTKMILGGAAVLLACATFVSCERGAIAVEATEPVELKTYEVPQEYLEDVRVMLRAALGTDEQRIGRVTKGPGGTLLVVAPARVQAGVQAILEKGFEAPPSQSPVKLTYWFLVGRPSKGAPFSVAGGRKLPQLESVMGQIAIAQGPTEFMLMEQVQLTSMSQQRAQAAGRFSRVTQRATRTGSQIVADVEISLNENGFQSQVLLEKGQFLVLGQTGFGDRDGFAFPEASNDDDLTLYYVMAADLEP